jgi:hypothetical protein
VKKLYFLGRIRIPDRTNWQFCSGASAADPGSGCFFDLWFRDEFFLDPGSRFPDPGSQTHISESLETLFGVKIQKVKKICEIYGEKKVDQTKIFSLFFVIVGSRTRIHYPG